jgi:hypothetical protein
MGASTTPNLIFSRCTDTDRHLTWSLNIDSEAA